MCKTSLKYLIFKAIGKSIKLTTPKVSIICLCHNQSAFVKETLTSVTDQTYSKIEIIVIDDGSEDGSKEVIADFIQSNTSASFIDLPQSIGNCKAFNKGFEASTGDYIIDLSCDDVMLPHRVQVQVSQFEQLDKNYGVVFSNAQYINEVGDSLSLHFQKTDDVPEGDIYLNLIDTYFVAAPTMMVGREVLEKLGGYDGELAYEDFDFWVRSSREHHYSYNNEVLTNIRKTSNSKSTGFYKKDNKMILSTLVVCEKIQELNKSNEEQLALIRRVRYELKHCALRGNLAALIGFYNFLKTITHPNWQDQGLFLLGQLRLDLSFIIRIKRNFTDS